MATWQVLAQALNMALKNVSGKTLAELMLGFLVQDGVVEGRNSPYLGDATAVVSSLKAGHLFRN